VNATSGALVKRTVTGHSIESAGRGKPQVGVVENAPGTPRPTNSAPIAATC